MTTIHWHRPGVGEYGHDRRHELRVSAYDWGDVSSIAAVLISKIRHQGHEVIEAGGDYTGADGRPRGIWFDVIVTLDGHEPMRWQHAVCETSDEWLKPIPTTPTQGDDPA